MFTNQNKEANHASARGFIRLLRAALLLAAVGAATLGVSPPAAADAPACRYTISGGAAFDVDTKLTWQRDAGSMTALTRDAAEAACAALGLPGGPWRLPTLPELQTIVDESKTSPAMDVAVFTDGSFADFWTSTPVASDTSMAWSVSFFDGRAFQRPVTDLYAARCVR